MLWKIATLLTFAATTGSLAVSEVVARVQGAPAPQEDPAPLPFVPGSETIVLLPDTQNYSQYFPQHFTNQTKWIRDHVQERNIRAVLGLGDITNNNHDEEWKNAKASIEFLRGAVPFALALGNHDLGENGSTVTRDSKVDTYLPLDEYRKDMNVVAEFEKGKMANLAHTFKLAGQDWLVLNVEFGPRDAVLKWADGVVRRHRNHKVILITHAYLYSDDTRYDFKTRKQTWNPHDYPVAKLSEAPNDGEEIWDKLVRKHKNMVFVFNGHVLNDGLGRFTSRGDQGNMVHQHLVNYQMLHEGGEGYLRLVEFLPDGRTVQFRSYSPSLDKYKTDEQNQFTVDLIDGTVKPRR